MTHDAQSVARLAHNLDRVERCLLFAETTAGVLRNDARVERYSLIAQLGRETQTALVALLAARRELEAMRGRGRA